MSLYLIEILHQTTTSGGQQHESLCCILSKFYIKPQHLARFQPLTFCCILSKFYIKPQQNVKEKWRAFVVSYRNSTSNHNFVGAICIASGVVSYRNSTSNHNHGRPVTETLYVVSYRNSTSNHNDRRGFPALGVVVSYRNSTSNHNVPEAPDARVKLYLIEILHQTTTYGRQRVPQKCCILSKFYIKPQLLNFSDSSDCVVSYRNSTSNHNCSTRSVRCVCVVSYRNSTSNHNIWTKQQLTNKVVSYRNSTSNHNWKSSIVLSSLLYLIEILHQTTTEDWETQPAKQLYLIEILHQTTTMEGGENDRLGCILSKFYIKPQHNNRRICKSSGCILSKFYIKPQLRSPQLF